MNHIFKLGAAVLCLCLLLPVVGVSAASPGEWTNANAVLATSDYYSLIRAAHALALDAAIESVFFEHGPIGAWAGQARPAASDWGFCYASDAATAQFTQTHTQRDLFENQPFGVANANGEFVLQGLKPGKVSITYCYPSDWPHAVGPIEITVVDRPHPSPSTMPTDANPDTGDGFPTAMLAGLMLACGGWALGLSGKKRGTQRG